VLDQAESSEGGREPETEAARPAPSERLEVVQVHGDVRGQPVPGIQRDDPDARVLGPGSTP